MKKQDGDSVWYEGYCIDLFKELAKILKFTYEFYPTPDGYYGAKTENGTWNGLIGELIKKVYNYVYEHLYPKTIIHYKFKKKAIKLVHKSSKSILWPYHRPHFSHFRKKTNFRHPNLVIFCLCIYLIRPFH